MRRAICTERGAESLLVFPFAECYQPVCKRGKGQPSRFHWQRDCWPGYSAGSSSIPLQCSKSHIVDNQLDLYDLAQSSAVLTSIVLILQSAAKAGKLLRFSIPEQGLNLLGCLQVVLAYGAEGNRTLNIPGEVSVSRLSNSQRNPQHLLQMEC